MVQSGSDVGGAPEIGARQLHRRVVVRGDRGAEVFGHGRDDRVEPVGVLRQGAVGELLLPSEREPTPEVGVVGAQRALDPCEHRGGVGGRLRCGELIGARDRRESSWGASCWSAQRLTEWSSSANAGTPSRIRPSTRSHRWRRRARPRRRTRETGSPGQVARPAGCRMSRTPRGLVSRSLPSADPLV